MNPYQIILPSFNVKVEKSPTDSTFIAPQCVQYDGRYFTRKNRKTNQLIHKSRPDILEEHAFYLPSILAASEALWVDTSHPNKDNIGYYFFHIKDLSEWNDVVSDIISASTL